ncbi:MAG: endopeptidase La [Treponemataceae bacterium]|nr:endopeptidase La [Treponemataceae bacterium]
MADEKNLTIVPIAARPIFPGVHAPIIIENKEVIKSVEAVMSVHMKGPIGVVMQKNASENPTFDDLYEMGTTARILRRVDLPDGRVNLFLSTVKRFRIKKRATEGIPLIAEVEYPKDEYEDTFEVKALQRALNAELIELGEVIPVFGGDMALEFLNGGAGLLTDLICSTLECDREVLQRLLETTNIRQRLEQLLVLVRKEQEIYRIQKKVVNELNERVERNQREYYLKEELRTIKEELGMTTDAKSSEYLKFKEKIDEFNFTGEIKETVYSELEKFQLMEPNSSEFIVSRNYLETVANLPWKDPEPEKYDLAAARKILDEDHYGLDDVKKRIIEYLSVRKLKGDSKGSIILLVGPPGVGKTSVGRSIARAMNKPFFRFSVGGMRDEAEIKGHRRTYVGAMPGKLVQGLKIVKTKSPVFMIDEVDKMGQSYQGDPASALLEVLDPEQNVSFRDQYLDLPFDVSNVVFILTANTLDSIPEPLLDRAEIITLSGYIDQEKVEIAKNYLIPKNLEKNGLHKNQVKYPKSVLLKIANEYAREAGVRNFEKNLDKIHRKYAAEIVSKESVIKAEEKLEALIAAKEDPDGKDTAEIKAARKALLGEQKVPVTLSEADLEKYLGKPVFDEEEILKADKPGTAIGLAWTSMGGDTLLIEAMDMPSGAGREGLYLTGQLGDVMRESAAIAMSYVRSYAIKHQIKKPEWFNRNCIHLHIPEGATPKDGPSAGITMATALMSLICHKKIKPRLAMTGELSLMGKVLPIGGLKEKTVAAKRNKIKTVLIPKQNVRDLDEIPEHVKESMTFVPVSTFEDVLAQIF